MNPQYAASQLRALADDLGVAQDLTITADGEEIVIHYDVTGEDDDRCVTFEAAVEAVRAYAAA